MLPVLERLCTFSWRRFQINYIYAYTYICCLQCMSLWAKPANSLWKELTFFVSFSGQPKLSSGWVSLNPHGVEWWSHSAQFIMLGFLSCHPSWKQQWEEAASLQTSCSVSLRKSPWRWWGRYYMWLGIFSGVIEVLIYLCLYGSYYVFMYMLYLCVSLYLCKLYSTQDHWLFGIHSSLVPEPNFGFKFITRPNSSKLWHRIPFAEGILGSYQVWGEGNELDLCEAWVWNISDCWQQEQNKSLCLQISRS